MRNNKNENTAFAADTRPLVIKLRIFSVFAFISAMAVIILADPYKLKKAEYQTDETVNVFSEDTKPQLTYPDAVCINECSPEDIDLYIPYTDFCLKYNGDKKTGRNYYDINVIGEEYSDDVDRGNVLKVYSYRSSKTEKNNVLDVVLSKGSKQDAEQTKCDLKNLSEKQQEFIHQDNGSLTMENSFFMSGGEKLMVSISGDDLNGKMKASFIRISNPENDISMNAMFSDNNGETVIYKEPFLLKAEDYDSNGEPDFLIRVCEPEDGGSRYKMLLTDISYEMSFAKINTPKSITEEDFFIYGKEEDALLLDRIDRSHFYFLTLENDSVVPVVLKNTLPVDSEDFIHKGMIFSSSYEDGVIRIKGQDISGSKNSLAVSGKLKRLKGKFWKNTDTEFSCDIIAEPYSEGFVTIEKELEKGVYRLDCTAEDDMFITEFIVR